MTSTSKSTGRLWLYWEGPMPPYIRLCADLLLAHNDNAVLLTPEDLPGHGFTSDVISQLATWHVCQRSDAIRAILLADRGGMWCDLDCIPMRSYEWFIRAAQTSPAGFAAYDSTDDTIGVGFVAARAGGDVVTRWRDHVLGYVERKQVPGWLDVSSQPVTEIIRHVGRHNCVIIPLNHVQPISWRTQDVFLQPEDGGNHKRAVESRPAAWCFMLSHQAMKHPGMSESIESFTRHECLTSGRLLSHLFRESIRRLVPFAAGRGRAVVTINVHGDGLPHNFRQSHRAAAERWGAEYVEITRPIVPWPDAYWEKLNLDRHTEAYDRIVYVDRDVVIRSDCPDLFEMVSPDTIAAVSSEQPGHNLMHHIRPAMDPLCHMVGVDMRHETEYINSGVLVFSPHRHGHVFEAARLLHSIAPHRGWEVIDQGCIGLAIQWAQRLAVQDSDLCLLPNNYNRCGSRLWDDWTPEMGDYIWHFCGQKDWGHMAGTRWDISEPR